jgi:CubicO group peptidase (beta-lactamase class C family)
LTTGTPSIGHSYQIGSVGEYYWAGYAGTYFWVDPKEELFAVYMMQSVEHLVPYAQKFKRQVLYSVVD